MKGITYKALEPLFNAAKLKVQKTDIVPVQNVLLPVVDSLGGYENSTGYFLGSEKCEGREYFYYEGDEKAAILVKSVFDDETFYDIMDFKLDPFDLAGYYTTEGSSPEELKEELFRIDSDRDVMEDVMNHLNIAQSDYTRLNVWMDRPHRN